MEPNINETVIELHRDLARKYQRHGPRIEQLWQSLNQGQREKVMRNGARDGIVLKHSLDTDMGDVYKFIPEWNLRDVTATSSNFFLDMLKHRATSPLMAQYAAGMNGGSGDHAHIVHMMQTKNLRLANEAEYQNCWNLFIDAEQYGQAIKVIKREALKGMESAIQAQLIIPQVTGHMVLMRQLYLLQALNIAMEDILEQVSTRARKNPSTEPASVAHAALAKLSLHAPPQKKLEMPDLIDSSLDQKSALEDYINLISTEPTVLAHNVNFWFFTRPELVADEKGRSLNMHTDKFINGAVVDAVQDSVKTAAIWDYMSRLLVLLRDSSDKALRTIALLELSNTCHLEYARAQAMLKRSVCTESGGNKWFKRMGTTNKDGSARIAMKRNPESLTVENPQLHYILRLCQDETNWSKAAEWLQKLEDLHRAHPLEQQNISKREFDSLGDLAIITTFIQALSSVVKLPTASQKKGQCFASGYKALENEIRELKTDVDLGDFAIPIGNLLEPGMSRGALATLDDYFVERTGSKLGFLYQDLVDDSMSNISKQYEQEKLAAASKAKVEYVVPTAPESMESRIQERKQKEKTRPAHSSVYQITPQDSSTAISDGLNQSKQTLKVKETTTATFSSLLARSGESRASVTWDAFVAAMADVGFAVVPKVGSIYTFIPPEKLDVQRNLTLHRPHQARIEGVRQLLYSRRLKRVYGWDEETFVVA